ncbi:hypothetical protein [Kocuria aegyptia]|uniref:Uncharacterized protein n=1 Tax=Kocuria aegyptia TaxID=330943 RepID=A0ABN2K7A1_9MICC
MTQSGEMNTQAPHAQQPTTSTTTRTITRTSFALLTAVLFAAAIFFGDIEFITAALLAGVAGIALDVRHTMKLPRVRSGHRAGR